MWSRRVSLVFDLIRDARYGARLLARSPVFTVVAVLSLGMGIGANTAMFTVVDALMLKRLPVSRPDELVFFATHNSPPGRSDTMPYLRSERLREPGLPLTSIAAIWAVDRSNLHIDNAPAGADEGSGLSVRIGLASSEYFSTMGVEPVIGRTWTGDEGVVTAQHPLAVVSHAFWQSRLGSPASLAGRMLRLNGVSYELIGVMPRGFAGEWVGMSTDVWVPFSMAGKVMPELPQGARAFPTRVIGRLRPGTTNAQATAAAGIAYRQMLRDDAGSKLTAEREAEIAAATVELSPGARGFSPQRHSYAQSLWILMAGVALLLVVACANLANLLLARSAVRQREMALRLAVGAGHGRIMRQILTETALIALAGGAAGLAIAVWATNLLAALIASAPVSLAGQSGGLFLDLHLDPRALVFTTAVCFLTGLLCGIGPALATRTLSLAPALREGGTRVVGLGRFLGPSTALLVSQVAVSLVLLVGAALFGETVRNLRARDLGMERQHELLVWTVPGQTGRQDVAMADLWHRVQEQLSVLPGVIAVGAGNQAVLSGALFTPAERPGVAMFVEGEPEKPTTSGGVRVFVTPKFFDALGVRFTAGRDFTERDTESAGNVVIINESMARFYFGNRSAIGRMVHFSPKVPTEIVGVVRDHVKGTPRSEGFEFNTYFPYRHTEALNKGAQTRLRVMMIAIRTAGDPLALAERVRAELRAIDPLLPVIRINTTEQQLDDVLAQERLVAVLSSALGGLAVFLACLGLFGVVSYRVARRTNEIGVRLAFGATRVSVLTMILVESGRLVLIGLVIGLGAVLALVRLISTRLYGVAATDLVTLAGASALLLLVTSVAAYIPARRAAVVDPATALRCD